MHFINKKIENIPNIHQFFDTDRAVVGWGRKPSFFKAQAYAQQHHLPVICAEDGFIRSLGLGKQGYPPLSLVTDQTGIYFDATQPSDLEDLILCTEDTEKNKHAQYCMNLILQYGITKYNQKYNGVDSTLFKNKKNILVVDQTYADQSIKYAGATENTFTEMLLQAVKAHPDATIWVKTHPDVMAGKAKGHFNSRHFNDHVKPLTQNYNPYDVLKLMDEVYVVSSHLGFEALLAGKTVHCFGMPWYAGWGLTLDRQTHPRRVVTRSLAHLFVQAYMHYARYVCPVTQKRCTLEHILHLMIVNTQAQNRLPNNLDVYGFSRWKRVFMKEYLDFPQLKVSFKWRLPVPQNTVFAWGKKAQRLKQKNYKNIWTVEDGFIRSLGLGATLIRPYSLVFDAIGIYYDATQPSFLEQLLNEKQLSEQQHQRANDLIKKILDTNVSKYNVGTIKTLQRPDAKQVILVVGQVEDDMSVQLGGVDIKTNLALLQMVRENNPTAYIIYKPHPDVHAGLRVGKIDATAYADKIELETSILDCFKICDEVHTISSLSGFEALLRGLKVYCYGLPFYAGWGLTQDRHICKRRNKIITLPTLVYMTLVEYPVYNVPVTKCMRLPFVTPEIVIDYIQQEMQQPKPVKKSFISQIFTRARRMKLGNYR